METYYEITPAEKLQGYVPIQGSKNAVLPMLAASLLTEEPISFVGCPDITDVRHTICILRLLGARCVCKGSEWLVDASEISKNGFEQKKYILYDERCGSFMRASILFLGAMLGRFGQAFVPYPGGCKIGTRPINLHLQIVRDLGGHVEEQCCGIYADGKGMKGGKICLPFPSVGATQNAMLMAVLLKGTTVIEGAAREPEIVSLAELLNRMGGKVFCAGTKQIMIEGVERLHGCRMSVPKDRIVAGTYLTAIAAVGGQGVFAGVQPKELEKVLILLSKMGCKIRTWFERECPYISIEKDGTLAFGRCLRTEIYPGFPTDLQSQFGVLLATVPGEHKIKETIFENRFDSLMELNKMGGHIYKDETESSIVHILGGRPLLGARVHGYDLRGAAALAIAGLKADGVTKLSGIEYLLRGYEDFIGDMAALGAKITERNGKDET